MHPLRIARWNCNHARGCRRGPPPELGSAGDAVPDRLAPGSHRGPHEQICKDEQADAGAYTGVLVKDFRGKNADQVIWKFDAAVEAAIRDALKQVAIEEGQWTEKRHIRAAADLAASKRESTAAVIAWRQRRRNRWRAARSGRRRRRVPPKGVVSIVLTHDTAA